MDEKLLAAIFGFFGAAFGAVVGAATTTLNTYLKQALEQRAEERRRQGKANEERWLAPLAELGSWTARCLVLAGNGAFGEYLKMEAPMALAVRLDLRFGRGWYEAMRRLDRALLDAASGKSTLTDEAKERLIALARELDWYHERQTQAPHAGPWRLERWRSVAARQFAAPPVTKALPGRAPGED